MAEPMLDVLVSRGAERVMVVFGDDGMDELTTTTTSTVLELTDGRRRRWTLDPATLGLATAHAGRPGRGRARGGGGGGPPGAGR